LFTVVFVVVLRVGDRHNNALSWAAFGVVVLLLWVPIAVQWAVAVRDSGRAFRAGLSDD
jgi:threonine/homoserine/homoserine lactone efflux protein